MSDKKKFFYLTRNCTVEKGMCDRCDHEATILDFRADCGGDEARICYECIIKGFQAFWYRVGMEDKP